MAGRPLPGGHFCVLCAVGSHSPQGLKSCAFQFSQYFWVGLWFPIQPTMNKNFVIKNAEGIDLMT